LNPTDTKATETNPPAMMVGTAPNRGGDCVVVGLVEEDDATAEHG
jgi:hypothetical protein